MIFSHEHIVKTFPEIFHNIKITMIIFEKILFNCRTVTQDIKIFRFCLVDILSSASFVNPFGNIFGTRPGQFFVEKNSFDPTNYKNNTENKIQGAHVLEIDDWKKFKLYRILKQKQLPTLLNLRRKVQVYLLWKQSCVHYENCRE